MTLYSYIVTHDTGFSPNPFFGYCTLACCKPGIRKHAKKGDWIVGLTPKADGNKIVYYMKVDEIMGFGEYWRDKRFSKKRPDIYGGIKRQNGDNIYRPSKKHSRGYHQQSSVHSEPKFGKRENPQLKRRDLSGERVLVSRHFAYFGSEPIELPEALDALRVGRSYRCHFESGEDIKRRFVEFATKQGFGGYMHCPHWRKKDRVAESACRS